MFPVCGKNATIPTGDCMVVGPADLTKPFNFYVFCRCRETYLPNNSTTFCEVGSHDYCGIALTRTANLALLQIEHSYRK